MRGSFGRWAVAAAVLAAAATPVAAVTIDLGTAIGEPGDTVAVPVSLLAEGATVIATQNRIDFDRQAYIPAKSNGQPDCTVNPAIDKEATGFRFLPLGCDPATACTGVRVFVLSFDNLDPIADGLLYTCQVKIDPATADGDVPLTLAELGASAPGGVLLPADGDDGAVTVVSEPDAGLVVGTAQGEMGDQAAFAVTLNVLEPGAEVVGAELDIGFTSSAPIAHDAGAPLCTVNPAIDKDASFAFTPAACDPSEDCTGIHASISAGDSEEPIADGATLFTCVVDLVEVGTFPLTASNPAATASGGAALLAVSSNGAVIVDEAPPPLPACAGDCNDDRTVAINELLIGVNIVIGSAELAACPAFDTSDDGEVTVSELIQAVNAALNGCPIGE